MRAVMMQEGFGVQTQRLGLPTYALIISFLAVGNQWYGAPVEAISVSWVSREMDIGPKKDVCAISVNSFSDQIIAPFFRLLRRVSRYCHDRYPFTIFIVWFGQFVLEPSDVNPILRSHERARIGQGNAE
jgi:hypothetical protein